MEITDILIIVLRLAGTLAFGHLLGSLLFPEQKKILWIISFPIGLALNSLFVFWIYFFDANFLFVDVLQIGGILLFSIRFRKLSGLQWAPSVSIRSACGITFWLSVAVALLFLIASNIPSPFGKWDAFAIWNLKARILASHVPLWDPEVSHLLNYSHPDYPLFLSASITLLFQVSQDIVLWPVFISILFTLAVAFIFIDRASALDWSIRKAVFAALSLLLIFNYLKMGGAQYADVPLAFFLLLGCVSLKKAVIKDDKPQLLLATGFFFGAATWVKNEGLMYFLIVLILVAVNSLLQKQTLSLLKRYKWILIGSLPFLFTTIFFKLQVKTENDILASASGTLILDKTVDLERYLLIFEHFSLEIINFSGTAFQPFFLLVILIVFSIVLKMKWRFFALAKTYLLPFVVLSLLGFFMVYLITPHDLKWHLETSLSRLLIQVYPVFVLLIFEILPETFLQPRENSKRQ